MMAHTRWSHSAAHICKCPSPLTCTMTMAAGHEEPEASFTIFIKPVERLLGRIYKNCKAKTRIGWIFSSVTTTRLSTL